MAHDGRRGRFGVTLPDAGRYSTPLGPPGWPAVDACATMGFLPAGHAMSDFEDEIYCRTKNLVRLTNLAFNSKKPLPEDELAEARP